MSVSKNKRRGGTYEVRWREGGRRMSRTFVRKADAEAFDVNIRRRKQLGALAPSVVESKQTLAAFVEDEWWPHYAIPNLATDTRRRYLEIWGKHLLPRVGGYPIRDITPRNVEELRGQLDHATGAPTARKTLMLLQAIMRRAVVHGLIPANPVQVVAKPKQKPTIRPQPLDPLTIERIRIQLRPRDQMIVSLLAYAGLRPSEDRAVRWGDLEHRTLHIYASKTGRARDVELLAPLAQDLAEWRLASGRPGPKELIVPRPTGGEWSREDWANWRRRIWRPAAIAAGVAGDLRPYRLRSSFVSLLLWEGRSLPYVADQAGHSIATLANHYAGVIRSLEDQPRVPAAETIRAARAQVVGSRQLSLA
jgi:integrase